MSECTLQNILAEIVTKSETQVFDRKCFIKSNKNLNQKPKWAWPIFY